MGLVGIVVVVVVVVEVVVATSRAPHNLWPFWLKAVCFSCAWFCPTQPTEGHSGSQACWFALATTWLVMAPLAAEAPRTPRGGRRSGRLRPTVVAFDLRRKFEKKGPRITAALQVGGGLLGRHCSPADAAWTGVQQEGASHDRARGHRGWPLRIADVRRRLRMLLLTEALRL